MHRMQSCGLFLYKQWVEAALKQPCLQAAFLCSKIITIIIICVINEALVLPEVLTIVGASLSEINTSVTSSHTCMCMLIGLLAWTGHLLQINAFINLTKFEHVAGNIA